MADPSPPTRDELLAWFREDRKRGWSGAARHFGIPADDVKAIVGCSLTEALGPGPGSPRGPTDHADADDEPYAVEDLEADIAQAIGKRVRWLKKDGSVGSRGEQGAAIALGILVDKLEKVRALARGQDGGQLDRGGEAAREDAVRRVRRAFGLDDGGGDQG